MLLCKVIGQNPRRVSFVNQYILVPAVADFDCDGQQLIAHCQLVALSADFLLIQISETHRELCCLIRLGWHLNRLHRWKHFVFACNRIDHGQSRVSEQVRSFAEKVLLFVIAREAERVAKIELLLSKLFGSEHLLSLHIVAHIALELLLGELTLEVNELLLVQFLHHLLLLLSRVQLSLLGR